MGGKETPIANPGSFDEIDLKIVAALRQDGRMPVLEIARITGVPEATARKRLQRLISQGLLRIVAVSSARALGYRREVTFAISAAPGRAMDVAQRLAGVEAVQFVSFGIGAFDLLVHTAFKSDDDLFQFVTQWMGTEGIESYQSMDVMAVFKRTDDWVVRREMACG